MPNVRGRQTSLSAGEVDPDLIGRDDLELYDTGAASLRNCEPRPAGLYRPRGGFRDAGLSYRTQMVAVAGGVPSTPGGRVAIQADFGSATEISAVDVRDILISAEHSDAFQIEYSDDAASWTAFGSTFDSGSNNVARSRRAALDPGQTVSARYWRCYMSAAASADFVSVVALDFFVEDGTESEVVGQDFAYDSDAAYALFLTAGHVDIYRNEVRVGSARLPYTSAQIPTVSDMQSLDTMVLFHVDVAPYRIYRQGGDSEWDFRDQAFENLPDVDFGDKTYTNGVNEKQEVWLENMTDNFERFTLQLGTETTGAIVFSATPATMVTRISDALQALDNVGSGNVTVTALTSPYNDVYEVEFTNDAGSRPWPIMVLRVWMLGSGDEVFDVNRTQTGEYGGEAIMSSTRGYPACGTFYQGRTILGGFRERPSSLLLSVTGDFFNFDTDIEEADGAFEARIDADQVKRIRRIYPGRNLQIFTDAAEFYVADRSISKDGPFSATIATRRGIEDGINVFELEGAVLFIQEGGEQLRGFIFSDAEQSYRSESLSVLSSHLLSSPVAMAHRQGGRTSDPDQLWVVNSDGTAAVMSAVLSQNFRAWWPVDTDGEIKALAVENNRTLYAAVKRQVNGAYVYRVEVYDAAELYDAGKTVTLGAPAETAAGFDHLEGKTVELWIDGAAGGEALVSSGSVALPFEGTEIRAGLGYPTEWTILPIRADIGGSVINRKKRIFEVALMVEGAGELEIAANGRPARRVPVRQYGVGGLGPVDSDLFTGEIRISGLIGYTLEGQFTISQAYRAPLEVRAAIYDARIN